MYSKHFNLDENPFSIAPDPRYLYMSDKHREALGHLMYGLKSDGGFILLTGEVGTGKTTVFRCLLEQLPEDIDLAFIINPKLTADELLASVCDELGIGYPKERSTGKQLVDAINHFLLKAHGLGRKTVLVIDEAQNLSADVLEQIRLLTNLETNQRKLLQVIMIGQPELRDLLAKKELRQLAQRITARYHLGPLSRQEISHYINHRLTVAGDHRKIFNKGTISSIYSLTNGIPRLINVLCDRALLGTYAQGHDRVDKKTLRRAAREVFDQPGGWPSPFSRIRVGLSFLAAMSLIAGIFALTGPWSTGPAPDAPEKTTTERSFNAPGTSPDSRPASQITGLVPALAWPEELNRTEDAVIAARTLLTAWSITATETEAENLCETASHAGLDCLHRSGSLGSLVHLDRPAILSMLDSQGRGFKTVLVRLNDRSATFRFQNHNIQTARTALEKQWFGEYTILWHPPPSYQRPIHPGRPGPDLDWLTTELSKIPANAHLDRNSADFKGDLAAAIRSFQRNQGLRADGFAGPETIIRLRSIGDQRSPRLRGENNVLHP